MSERVRVLEGDIFKSECQSLVNTVNTVGVMGKGIALGFKRRFPEMFVDYQRRCKRGEVRLGEPYVYKEYTRPWIVNFPTKGHWRSAARLVDIIDGLHFLVRNSPNWAITSLACPPLGCGEGRLEWRNVGPYLYQSLTLLNIPVELYAPHGTPAGQLTAEFLLRAYEEDGSAAQYRQGLEPATLALAEIIWMIQREPHHWPVGHVTFQKLAYFATVLGIPTGITFEKKPYGPFGDRLKNMTSQLVNNALLEERSEGDMIRVIATPRYADTRPEFAGDLSSYQAVIRQVADMALRLTPNQLEVAAAAHWAAGHLPTGNVTEEDILAAVIEWKHRRFPELTREEVALTIRVLGQLGLLRAKFSPDLPLADPSPAVA